MQNTFVFNRALFMGLISLIQWSIENPAVIWELESVIFKLISRMVIVNISCKIAISSIRKDLTDD